MKSIWNMLEMIHGLVGTKDLTKWETEFVQSCYDDCSHNKMTDRLSGKRVEIINDIFNKHFA